MSTALAIVVPLYKPSLNGWERRSLERLIKVCASRRIILIGPENIRNAEAESILSTDEWRYFNRGFFRGTYQYTWLLLSSKFYQTFSDFQSILIHQTDAFLFRDDLDEWLGKYSYVGGPWYFKRDFGDRSYGVGNGGLSLRIVSDHLNVLSIAVNLAKSGDLPKLSLSVPGGIGTLLAKAAVIARVSYFPPRTINFVSQWSSQEDIFFGLIAPRLSEEFSVPNADVAARFAIDEHPRFFFNKYCGGKVPMGFHAFGRDDEPRCSIDFWEEKIREENEQ